MSIIVKRLKPGADLRPELRSIARNNDMSAGVLLSMVGSLREANIRFADQETGTVIYGPLEIVSATGTISTAGLHVHVSVSDRHGRTIGGHMLDGCYVFTTCEVVMMNISSEWKFEHELDDETGHLELHEIRTKPK